MQESEWLRRARRSGGRFVNPVPSQLGGLSVVAKLLPEYMKSSEAREPAAELVAALGSFQTDPTVYAQAAASGLRVTWFGHSASLVELDGARVLIDPVWDARASPVSWAGPKRFFPPTLPLEQMPALDAIVISHDHYDHLGRETVGALARLQPQAVWVTPLGVGRWLRQFGVAAERVRELDWTEGTEVVGAAGGVRLTAWPARHFSGRWPWDRFKTLWAAWTLEGQPLAGSAEGHRVYYGADSGYWEGIGEVGKLGRGFDLTMLEIGAFHPAWAEIHMGPAGAARSYRALGGPERAGLLMPVHWGLFNLALHGWLQPIGQMREIAAAEGWGLWLPRLGAPTEVQPGVALENRWYEK